MDVASKKTKRGCLILVIGVPVTLFALLAVLAMIDMAINPNREPAAKESALHNADPKKINAQPPAAATQETATAPESPAATKTPAKPGEIQALAEETLRFIDEGQKTIGYAIQSGDGQAVRDEVVTPAWVIQRRWHEYGYGQYYAYEACYDAIDALNAYAEKLTQSDSVARRRSMDYNATRLEKLLPKCKRTVDSNGRIRSDE